MGARGSSRGSTAPAGNDLRVAAELSLGADYMAGGSTAILGKRGSGKTYTCRVLAEELLAAHVHLVILDPMGAFWGLRAGVDGTSEGLPIPIFGGQHGDIPLESSAGALIADLVVEERLSMILDMSGFTSRTQERSFAAAFFDRLYRRNRDLVHVLIDEADLYAPQKPQQQEVPLLATMENLVRRGRNKGIGVSMTSQRPAVLNKDLLSQVDALVAMRVVSPQDRAAIREWVRGQGTEEQWAQIAPSLPNLTNGESWWWIPEHRILQRVTVRPARTFDSSPTRKRGQASRAVTTLTDIDLSAISQRMAATIERAKEADPRQLRRHVAALEAQIADLRSELAVLRDQPPVATVDEDLIVRLQRATDTVAAGDTALTAAWAEFEQRLHTLLEQRTGQVHQMQAAAAALTSAPTPNPAPPLPPKTSPVRARRRAADPAGNGAVKPPPVAASPPIDQAAGEESLTPARRRLLNALATLESIGVPRVGRTQLALWSAVSPKSSGYANNLGGLRTAGLIDYPETGAVALTSAGRAVADPPDTVPVTEADLHRQVRDLVTPARWRLLEQLLTAHPEPISRADLAGRAGVSATSSGYANNLGGLHSLGLIDYPRKGFVAAGQVLFLSGD